MTTYISYETSKWLKEFLKESAPEPMDMMYWRKGTGDPIATNYPLDNVPAYQLHDLLSEPFCKAMARKAEGYTGVSGVNADWEMNNRLSHLYFTDGLPAVEKALLKMMEDE